MRYYIQGIQKNWKLFNYCLHIFIPTLVSTYSNNRYIDAHLLGKIFNYLINYIISYRLSKLFGYYINHK